jgi:hypothetical protein
LVDFTDTMARTPGSRPSSVAASALISETIRKGPQVTSTWAITVSRTTRVTMPESRLRALTAAARSGTRWGWSANVCASTARSGPAITAGPVEESAASRPASIQRRTVSSLTPSSSAASAIR